MTDNQLIKIIHGAQALNDKWLALTPEQKRQLVNEILAITEGVARIVTIWETMQTIAPDEEKQTAVCHLCCKRRKIVSRQIMLGSGERVALCRKCSKRKF